ncbi:hypothetical protein QR680_000553 [Steinernema hermaphroditum]|uniref:Store-operated calcium entry-associated regulatory factor n=1 Tax=Steinernema hermaphroditum TaxID=289476 RepID=A0AA39GVQ9_9BILA|nr:hypothetical protein QR680_000553 [Steinernema hermaphroditum]
MMRFEGISYSKVLLSEVQVIKRIQPLEEDIPVRKSSVSDVADACDRFPPRSVQCYKRGSDGIDVQWECKADIPKKYRFGQISVSCEGFDHPGDPYVLHGSCGMMRFEGNTSHSAVRALIGCHLYIVRQGFAQ